MLFLLLVVESYPNWIIKIILFNFYSVCGLWLMTEQLSPWDYNLHKTKYKLNQIVGAGFYY